MFLTPDLIIFMYFLNTLTTENFKHGVCSLSDNK